MQGLLPIIPWKKRQVTNRKKTWSEKNEVIVENWEKSINNIYKTTEDNKLKQFSLKLLHLFSSPTKNLNAMELPTTVNAWSVTNQTPLNTPSWNAHPLLNYMKTF